MKFVKFSICILASVLVLNACKKKDDNSPGSMSRKDMLKSHPWIATDVLLNGSSIWNSIVQDCGKDDIYTFKDNDSMYADQGDTMCSPGNPQVSVQMWKLLDNDTKMIFYVDTVDVLEISPNKLRILRTDVTDKYEVRFASKP